MGNLAIQKNNYAAQTLNQENLRTISTENINTYEVKKVAKPDTIIVYDTIYVPSCAKPDTIFLSKEDQELFERVRKESAEIVIGMYKAIDGLGTDNELFEATLKKVNADNIYEVTELWNNTVGKEYGETFFEAFLGDANSSQRKTYGKQLLKAMEERSKLEGLETSTKRDEISKLFDKELSKLFVSDKKLNELFDKMTQVLEEHNFKFNINKNAPVK